MPVQMTENQRQFWRELLAEFPNKDLRTTSRGGKELTYITSRALANRLDSVCGPHGWDIEYEPTARGYKARMGILVPMSNGASVWLYKEDGAGFEEMGSNNKKTGEWEADVDNDEKSAYTNAFRRVCQNSWGIARYLYGDGMPDFCYDDPRLTVPAPAPAPQAPRKPDPEPTPAPAPSPAPQRGTTFDNFKIPRPGKAVFPWIKGLEAHYKTQFVNGVKMEAEQKGYGTTFNDWTKEQLDDLAANLIGYIRQLSNYGGEFGVAETAPTADPETLKALKTEIIDLVKVMLVAQSGRPAELGAIKATVGTIAAGVDNGYGNRGETLDSLKDCNDLTWLTNMVSLAKSMAVSGSGVAAEPDDNIPF